MKYATFCSGIGAPEVAVESFPGWDCIAQAEIEAFPSAVLAYRFPGVPNLGDITAADFVGRLAAIGLPDLVCAGIPCQPFSVAGLKLGTNDPRNLTSRFVEIANAIDDLRCTAGLEPAWWVIENVPGLLSDNPAMGALLAGLCGGAAPIANRGSWPSAGVVAGPRRVVAWRVLDAQFFGVPQRRRRVFILARGGAGGWGCADALLPITESLRGNPAESRRARQDSAVALGASSGGADDNDAADGRLIAKCGTTGTGRRYDAETETLIACASVGNGEYRPGVGTLRATGADCGGGSETLIAFGWQNSASQGDSVGTVSPTLDKSKTPAVLAVAMRGREGGATAELSAVAPALRAAGGGGAMPYCLAPAVFDGAQSTSKTNRSRVEPGAPAGTLSKASDMHAIVNFTSSPQPDTIAQQGVKHGTPDETYAGEVLFAVRKQVGEEALSEWGLGVLDSIRQEEVLQLDLLRDQSGQPASEAGPDHCHGALAQSQTGTARGVQSVREAGCARCSPPEWRLDGQLADEFAAYLSLLSHQGASRAAALQGLRKASEGIGVLQHALAAFQEMGRPTDREGQPVYGGAIGRNAQPDQDLQGGGLQPPVPREGVLQQARDARSSQVHETKVRRLLPVEAERLQGFPDNWTAVPYRNKPAADGPRYKAIGNSMAVPVMRWIFNRLDTVDKATAEGLDTAKEEQW